VDYTVPPPPPPLELAIIGAGGDAVLRWKNGIGPAYDIYAVQRGNPEPVRLNERAVGTPEFPLVGIPPGEYTFRVHTVDSARPAWLGPVSNETQLILEAPAQAVVEELKKFQFDLGKIQFATARAAIMPESDPILEAAAGIMRKYPEFKVRVEGHTDNVGGSASNKRLSQARAEAVVRYLVERKGIDRARLSAAGFGDARPIADNNTEAGRATNRRVEFVVTNLEEAH
jgi:outer membrane protein OmpA-like peptidoglycan-associated protein